MKELENPETWEEEPFWVFPCPGKQGVFEPIETPPGWKLRWTRT